MTSLWVENFRKWEWRFLIVFLYVLPVHEASKNVLWGILVTSFIARHIARSEKFQIGSLDKVIFIWLGVGLWSTFFAIEPAASWKGLWDMVRAAALFWIARSHLTDPTSQRRFVYHLIIASALAALIGWNDYFWKILASSYDNPRIHLELRSVGHYNQSGIYLAMAWLIALAAALDRKVFQKPWHGFFSTALIGLALLGTTARSSIAVAILGSIFFLGKAKAPKWMGKLIFIIITLTIIAMAASSGLRERFLARGSFHNRVGIWESALEAAKTRPWTGVGLNNFKKIQLQTESNSPRRTVDHAHNLYFTTLAQMGFPGLIALLILLTTVGIHIYLLRSNYENRLVFYAVGGVWFVIVGAGFSNTTLHHEMSLLFFSTLGLLNNDKMTLKV